MTPKAAGNRKKLALTAATRKLLTILNALLRDGQPRRAFLRFLLKRAIPSCSRYALGSYKPLATAFQSAAAWGTCMHRKANFQMLGWFWDLHNRGLLDLDPPYQRRSVWNQEYRDFFVDTVLRGLPCPAIFLYEEISPDGALRYSVVDGRQRLSTLFDFAHNVFPISEKHGQENLKGKYFDDLDDELKRSFWGYQFSVEYVASSNEQMISNIFDRINRDVARLTPQELRHARLSGEFISSSEELGEWMIRQLPINFPNLAAKSLRQMKDVELVAQLLLLIEHGPRSYTQDDLDQPLAIEMKHGNLVPT